MVWPSHVKNEKMMSTTETNRNSPVKQTKPICASTDHTPSKDVADDPYFKSIKKIMKLNKSYENGAQKSIEKYKNLRSKYDIAMNDLKVVSDSIIHLESNMQQSKNRIKELESSNEELKNNSKIESELQVKKLEQIKVEMTELEQKHQELEKKFEDSMTQLEEAKKKGENLQFDLDQCETKMKTIQTSTAQKIEVYQHESEEADTFIGNLRDALRNEEKLRMQLMTDIDNLNEKLNTEKENFILESDKSKEQMMKMTEVHKDEKEKWYDIISKRDDELKTLKSEIQNVELQLAKEIEERKSDETIHNEVVEDMTNFHENTVAQHKQKEEEFESALEEKDVLNNDLKKEIQELRAQIKKHEETEILIQKESDKKSSDIKVYQSIIAELTKNMDENGIKHDTVGSQSESEEATMFEDIESLKIRTCGLIKDFKNLCEQKTNQDKQILDIEKQLNEGNDLNTNLRTQIKEMEQNILNKSTEITSLKENVEKIEIMLQNKSESYAKDVEKYETAIDDMTQKMGMFVNQIAMLNDSNKNVSNEMDLLKQKHEEQIAQFEESSKEGSEAREALQFKIDDMTEEMQKAFQKHSIEIEGYEKTIDEFNTKITSGELELSNIHQMLRDEQKKSKEQNKQEQKYLDKIHKLEKSLDDESKLRANITNDLENIQEAVVIEINKNSSVIEELEQKLQETEIERDNLSEKIVQDVIKYEGIISSLEKKKRGEFRRTKMAQS